MQTEIYAMLTKMNSHLRQYGLMSLIVTKASELTSKNVIFQYTGREMMILVRNWSKLKSSMKN